MMRAAYYYVFDSRSGRPCITPGAQPKRRLNPHKALSRYVLDKKGEVVGRAFACWCAKQTWIDQQPTDRCVALWKAGCAQDPLGEKDATRSIVRDRYQDTALRATTIGVPTRDVGAAQFLAAWACTEPSVDAAMHDVMHMSCRWAEFAHPAESTTAVRAMERRHCNMLLDALGSSAPLSLFSHA